MFEFFINNSNVSNEFNIIIYNDKNKIIYRGKTINNKLKYNFKRNNLYTIKVINYSYGVYKTIPYYCIDKNKLYYYNISVPYYIRIRLYDTYYEKMPIGKGNIVLWNTK